MHEIDEISVYPKFAEELTNGGGAVLVGAHIGPTALLTSHLARSISATKIVTDSPASFHLARSKALIPRMHRQGSFLPLVLKYLREGNVVYWAGDTKGRENGPPSLAYYARVPIFWYSALWHNGKIVHQLRPGPSLIHGESLDLWMERWFSFYAQTFIDAVLSDPENIRPRPGYENLLRICDRARVPTDRIRKYLPQY